MKVVLLENIDKLGKSGETVNVSPGYARNYLLPKKMVLVATSSAQKQYAQRKRGIERKEAEKKQSMASLGEKIQGTTLTAPVLVGDEGKLFGSVTSGDVAHLLAEQGIEIDKRKIELDEPIKSIGTYEIPIRLHPEVKPTITVHVVSQEGPSLSEERRTEETAISDSPEDTPPSDTDPTETQTQAPEAA